MKEVLKHLKRIASKFPENYREDLVQDMTVLYLESPAEKQHLYYVNKYYPLKCLDFMRKYEPNNILSIDSQIHDFDGELITYADLLESSEDLEQQIIYDDMILNLKLTPTERLVQKLYYYDGFTVDEIVKNFSQKTCITSANTIYKILKKGQ